MAAPKQKTSWQYKIHNDRKVKPVYYNGASAGHGKFMAGQYENGELVKRDERVLPYRSI